MKKVLAGVVVAVAALGISVAWVTQTGPTEASQQLPRDVSDSHGRPETQAAAAGEIIEKPFLGISIGDLTAEDRERLGVDVGVLVRAVLDDGPSADLLLEDDVVLAVNGVNVGSAEELALAVRDLVPGDEAEISVIRDGSPVTVTVTVGERTITRKTVRSFVQKFPGIGGLGGLVPGLLAQINDKLISAEIVIDTDDGPMTYTALRGTVTRVDADLGEFDLVPADGSATTTYAVNDETVVSVTRIGDLSGLTVDEEAFLVLIDGDLKLVVQRPDPGQRTGLHSFGIPGFAIPGGRHGFDPNRLPRIRSHIRIDGLDSLRDRSDFLRDFLNSEHLDALLDELKKDIEHEVLVTQ